MEASESPRTAPGIAAELPERMFAPLLSLALTLLPQPEVQTVEAQPVEAQPVEPDLKPAEVPAPPASLGRAPFVPTPTLSLVGRAALAPVFGAAGGGLGVLAGLGLLQLAGTSSGGGLLAAFVGGLLVLAGLEFGIATAATLFARDQAERSELFTRSFVWTLGVLVVSSVLAAALISIPVIGIGLAIGSAVALVSSVPLLVEWHRRATAAESRPVAPVVVATF